MPNLFTGPAGPFLFRIEEWEPRGRHLTVLGAIASPRPAIDAYAAVVAARPGQELRLRYSPAGVRIDRGAMNFAIEEWDEAEHIVALHGLFVSLDPARVAYDVLAAGGLRLTLRKGIRVLREGL